MWFPQDDGGHQVRDIRSGEQVDADAAAWSHRRTTCVRRHRQTDAAADLTPTLTTNLHRHPRSYSVIRTHDAGTLRAEHAGQTVTLAGWVARRRDHGGVAFIDLRDACGVVQVVIRDEAVGAPGCATSSACGSSGEVGARPEGNANPNLPTGEIEVVANEVEVLSESAPLPFQIDEHVEVGEEVRLKYRYLDLRRAAPAAALRLRTRGQPRRPRGAARRATSSRSRRRR